MKKSILIAALIAFFSASFAQTHINNIDHANVVNIGTKDSAQTKAKKDTGKAVVKVPVQPKTYPGIAADKMVTLSITLPAGIIGDYATVESVGEDGVNYSDNISAKQATFFKKNHKTVRDSVAAKWYAHVKQDAAKWAADTVSKVKPIKKQ
ncbi:MAG: hypothetical protein ACXVAY_01355 [Mucilaginibacter sp.]